MLPHTASFKLSAPTCVHSSPQNARLWFVPIVQALRDLSRKCRDPIRVPENGEDVLFGTVASIGCSRSPTGVGFNVTHQGDTFLAQALTDTEVIGDLEATEFVAPVAVGRHRAHGLRLATKRIRFTSGLDMGSAATVDDRCKLENCTFSTGADSCRLITTG